MSEVSAITAVSAISANDKTSQSTAAQKAETVSFEAILRVVCSCIFQLKKYQKFKLALIIGKESINLNLLFCSFNL